jgi:RNA polymerase sigma factor for flagellar operon FliA
VHVLAAELGRAPTQSELALFMGKELDEFQRERGQAKRFETFSMEVVSDEVMSMPGDSSLQPEVMVEEAQFMDAVVGAIDEFHQMSLPGRAAGWDDLAFDALGAVVGATALRWRRVVKRWVALRFLVSRP